MASVGQFFATVSQDLFLLAMIILRVYSCKEKWCRFAAGSPCGEAMANLHSGESRIELGYSPIILRPLGESGLSLATVELGRSRINSSVVRHKLAVLPDTPKGFLRGLRLLMVKHQG